MKIMQSRLEKNAWDAFISENGGAIQQSWQYGAASGASVTRLEFHDQGRRVGCAQILLRSLFGLFTFGLITRGPVWKDAPRRMPHGIMKASGASFLLCTPERDTPDTSFALITGATHIEIDLSIDDQCLRKRLNGKWRNQLFAAELSGIRVCVSHDLDWILRRENENRQKARYRGLPEDFLRAYCADPGAWRLFVAHHEGVKIAGALFLLHGNRATYQCGWSGKVGRQLNAQKMVLWHAMTALKKTGTVSLDLGSIDTETTPGLARFKLGMGGAIIRLGATGIVLPQYEGRFSPFPSRTSMK